MSKVDLQDKEFLSALAHHAQALARIILKRSDSGYHLAEDAQVRIDFEYSWESFFLFSKQLSKIFAI